MLADGDGRVQMVSALHACHVTADDGAQLLLALKRNVGVGELRKEQSNLQFTVQNDLGLLAHLPALPASAEEGLCLLGENQDA